MFPTCFDVDQNASLLSRRVKLHLLQRNPSCTLEVQCWSFLGDSFSSRILCRIFLTLKLPLSWWDGSVDESAIKTNDLSSIPGTHIAEATNSLFRLSSDLYMCIMVHVNTYTHTHIKILKSSSNQSPLILYCKLFNAVTFVRFHAPGWIQIALSFLRC